MKKLGKQMTLYVDDRMSLWLDGKAAKGYKKASLIRHILQDRMEFEARQNAKDGSVVA